MDVVAGGRDEPVLFVRPGGGDGSFDPPSVTLEFSGAVGGLADIAVADFDRDGRLDVLASNPAGNLIAVALGDAATGLRAVEAIPIGGAPARLLVADLTGDGILDVAVTTATEVVLLRGQGDGSFTPLGALAAPAAPSDLVALDVTGDGILDLLAATPGADAVQIYAGDGTGGFTTAAPLALAGATTLAVGDFTADGRADLAVGTAGRDLVVAAGIATGLAAPAVVATAVPATRLLAADMNADGSPDLVAVDGERERGVARIVFADGAGGFRDEPLVAILASEETPGATVADFDADGVNDLAVSLPESREIVVGLSFPLCVGDCNYDRMVVINELITGVAIGLGTRPVAGCRPADPNRDLAVRINELVLAVNAALNGCP